jgi:uncharacterized protein YggE
MPDTLAVPPRPHLRVLGEGSAEAPPDRCVLHVGLSATESTVADALAKVAVVAGRAVESLERRGITGDAIRTVGLAVHDFFDPAQQRVTGHVAGTQLVVTVSDLGQVGRVVADLSTAVGGALQVQSLELTVADVEPLGRTARARAVAHAQAKAAELAAAAGVALGPVLSIEEQPMGGIPVLRPRAASMAGSASAIVPPLPIEPGALTVTAQVVMVYGIG